MWKLLAPIRTVKGIQFGILSPDEIRRMSVTADGISYPENDIVKQDGLLDSRQGAADKNSICKTCLCGINECPGHFGHINLNKAVFHPLFLRHVTKILSCVCYYCSKLLLSPNHPLMQKIMLRTKDEPELKLEQVYEICKGKTLCDSRDMLNLENSNCKKLQIGCGRFQPRFKRKHFTIIAEWKEVNDENQERRLPFSAERIYAIFKDISNEDCEALGMNPKFSRPEWMIITVLPVPPLSVRPILIANGSIQIQDDLTHILNDIVTTNNEIGKLDRLEVGEHLLLEHVKKLQEHVANLIDNDISGFPIAMSRIGWPLQGIKSRLEGKDGRIRSNLMGKRVNFSARTVITPDPNLEIDQIGIPKSIAQDLTFPELVNQFTRRKLEYLVGRGDKQYPGARYITRANGHCIDLKYYPHPEDLILFNGDKVERHVLDNDIVVLNRQPSLHKFSMMAHRVKVFPWSTFRMNLSCTSPYNADFDGDEMNLHIPQSLETIAEVENLQLSTRHILSPQSNQPIMGLVQDALTGVDKLTKRDIFLDKEQMQNLLMFIPHWDGKIPQPAILKPKHLWTGKQLFSLIIPGLINFSTQDEAVNWLDDAQVLIEQGELLMGTLCKNTIGTKSGTIFHVCMMELGHEITGKFYTNIQKVVNNWLLYEGHSIGIQDIFLNKTVNDSIRNVFKIAKQEISQLKHVSRSSFENNVSKILDDAHDKGGLICRDSLPSWNSLKLIVDSGSKGSNSNITQIMACVGQQIVSGERINYGFRQRTLPHFVKGDYGAESKGFVKSSYFKGLNPTEFYFHSMAGRESLIDAGIKIRETGYMQRRLIKSMESIMVNYDGTVRNSQGQVIQLIYGEDGMDGTMVESQTIPSLDVSNQIFQNKFKMDLNNDKLKSYYNDRVLHEVLESDVTGIVIEKEWELLCKDREELRKIFPTGISTFVLPCNLSRIIWNAQKLFPPEIKTDLSPINVIEGVQDISRNCYKLMGHSLNCKNENSTFLFQALIRSTLCSRRVAEEYRLTTQGFNWILENIIDKFQRSKVEPGEMVGVLAAQSIGEPTTQMTLNSFHYAGISSRNVTLGVARLNEIINVSKKMKFPSLTVYLNPSIAHEESLAKNIATQIEQITLHQILISSAIYYEPITKASPWILRLELNSNIMNSKHITSIDVINKISEVFGDNLIYDSSDCHEINIRVNMKEENSIDDENLLIYLDKHMLPELTIKGVDGIKNVEMLLVKSRVVIDEHTGTFRKMFEWILETNGCSLLAVLSVKDVDFTRTFSNDIRENFIVLGIEAARVSIAKESRHVLKSYQIFLNNRHLSLLCDVMTRNGYLFSINRYGINKQNIGPLAKCSFEQTVDALTRASVHAELDEIRGVPEKIILGQLPKLGTGCFDLLLDSKVYEVENKSSYLPNTEDIPYSVAEYPVFSPYFYPTEKRSPDHCEPQETKPILYNP